MIAEHDYEDAAGDKDGLRQPVINSRASRADVYSVGTHRALLPCRDLNDIIARIRGNAATNEKNKVVPFRLLVNSSRRDRVITLRAYQCYPRVCPD